MSIWKILAPLILLPFLITGLLYLVVIRRLMRGRLRPEQGEVGNSYLLPELYQKIFQESDHVLKPLGFIHHHDIQVHENSGPSERWRRVYFNEATRSYAVAHRSELKDLGLPFEVFFVNFRKDNQRITTVNGASPYLLAYPEDEVLMDPFAPSLKAQWRAHCKALGDNGYWEMKSPEQFTNDENRFTRLGFEQAVARGDMIKTDDGSLRISWKYAWIKSREMMAGGKKRKTIRREAVSAMAGEMKISPEANILSDVDRHHYLEAYMDQKPKSGWVFKTLIFLGSMVVFGVSFGLVFDGRFALILLGLLLFHELGHLAGMRLFGYKDTQILFIPFLGAVTMGNQEDAAPHQKIAIYLLGPAPGILLGLCLLLGYGHTQARWMWETGLLACLLNYTNLLPFMPLDGGQIVRVLLLARAPRLQAMFLTGSTMVVGAAALFLKDGFLGLLFVLLLISNPYHWRLSNLHVKLKKVLSGATHTEDERLHLILQAMNQPPFAKRSMADKFQMTREMTRRLAEKPASAPLILATLMLYAGFAALPLLVVFYLR